MLKVLQYILFLRRFRAFSETNVSNYQSALMKVMAVSSLPGTVRSRSLSNSNLKGDVFNVKDGSPNVSYQNKQWRSGETAIDPTS